MGASYGARANGAITTLFTKTTITIGLLLHLLFSLLKHSSLVLSVNLLLSELLLSQLLFQLGPLVQFASRTIQLTQLFLIANFERMKLQIAPKRDKQVIKTT